MPWEAAIARAETAIGHHFADRELLKAALTHASFADDRLNSNERLEFFGDAVLGMVVCEELYRRYPHFLEGEMTKIKSAVVSRRTCAKVGRHRELDTCIVLGKGMADQEHLPQSLLAAIYESIIGALYLDAGLEIARQFILQDMVEHIVAAAESENQRNFKSHLQQYTQKHFNSTPVYEMLDEKGPDHHKCFEVCVWVAGKSYPSAWGPNKKEAEQRAAFNALVDLNVLEQQDDPGMMEL
ncbi:MAG: Ribonuclease 3 [Phycisphaerae bacterium]|nr:Ribonuclease 3 [Phycisphaerae bacterium]